MLTSKHFSSEQELLDWANLNVRCGDIISIQYKTLGYDSDSVGDLTEIEDWILFYCD